ncbi:MAG: BatA domain-containing protein [Bacteroidota bacterium]
MSFLYPLFLVAGLSLAIPVLIHLFNLRRYKTVFFPHTRFLKNIQLNSRRQSQVRYKLLLALRLLFLAAMILAFAQPFFNKDSGPKKGNKLQVLYIDNSYSMSVKKGARNLLETAKDAVRKQIHKAHPGTKFVLLTNDKPMSYQPVPADKVLAELGGIEVSPNNKTAIQVLSTIQSIVQSEAANGAEVYYYSDFQRSSFASLPDAALMHNISFYGVPLQTDEQQNIYIDTAYLTSPVLQTGQSNQLVVHTKAIGKVPKDAPVLQLSINGQVKSAASLSFSQKNESVDTFSFQVNDAGWQKISLSVNDEAVRFDDTFRITARSAPGLSVLVLNEGQANPYIQAAFRAYNGFRLNQMDIAAAPKSWKEYNLVILSGITHIDDALGKTMNEALQTGQGITIFPGRTNNLAALNEGLHNIGDIRISAIDTAAQVATSLQQGSDLVKDLFEHIPDNVQLPTVNWHYIINAGLSANQQSILSFRNGDPFLARYKPSRGQLYLCAAAADMQSGNFPGSYFFVPFLYQMTMQSHGGDVYAITTGKQVPAYLLLNNANERNMIHVYGKGLDVIPPQRPDGAGLNVYIDQVVQQAGFYSLSGQSTDTTWVALNGDRGESVLDVWKPEALKSQWKSGDIRWMNATDASIKTDNGNWDSFPLWKVCVILAVIMLVAETLVLAGSFQKQTVATQ